MIPDFQTLMRPVLACSGKGQISISEIVQKLERQFELTDDEKKELIPSGKQTKFANRVHWARSYLKQAGLVMSVKRGVIAISESGKDALKSGELINKNFLERYESYLEFKSRSAKDKAEKTEDDLGVIATPDELLRTGLDQINSALASDLLERLRDGAPAFFEKTIVELLLKMGYGASKSTGKILGGSGDDGVDGVIDQDILGVDQVYVQAKRYALGNNIGSGAIRDFFGALSLKDVNKGIFVTTSDFSPKAKDTANKLGARIVLINGVRLAELMIAHEIGCRVEYVLKISRLDDSYFEWELGNV